MATLKSSADHLTINADGINKDIKFQANGVEKVTITSDGNVGIGTSAILGTLNIHGGTGDTASQDVVQTFTRTSSTGNVLAAKIRLDNSNTNHADLKFQAKTTASSAENSSYYTDALTIKGSTGIVTMPNQPAARWAWAHSGTGLVTSYTSIENNNSSFSIVSGKIYVPVTGWYSISVHGIAASSTGSFDSRILKNTTGNSPFLSDFRVATGGGGTHPGDGSTSVTHLNSGEYITTYVLSGAMYTGSSSSSPHCVLSIHLIG